ncbi:MAG: STAS domain-containing protein [Leptospira sp.]|nr:STAS domain-containing protein [Leptospira sp.]
MDYREEIIDNRLILHLEGNLDMLNAGIFKERMMQAIQEDHDRIIINLEKVSFVDSSGFGLLIIANDKFQKKSGSQLYITNVAKSIQQIFKISKIGDVMHIFDNLESAKNSNL